MSESRPPQIQVTSTRRAPAWAKLFTLAVVANLFGILAASAMARFIGRVPATDQAEQLWRLAYYAGIAVAAIFDALLLDEVWFKGAFRRTHLLGRVPGFARKDDDVEGVAVSMQRSTISFPLLVLAAGFVTSLFYDVAINRGFEDYYRDVGKDIGALRRGDTNRKITAIENLSVRRRSEVLPALKWALAEGGDAAPWAAWAIGRHRDLKIRKPLIAALQPAVRSDDPVLRREALIALGRLQQRTPVVAEALQDLLRADLEAGSIDPRLLYALGSIQVVGSAEVLEDVLQRGDPESQRLAAWALAQHRDQRESKPLVDILEARLATADVGLRCALVHALGIFAHERSNLALMHAYDESPPEELAYVCPRIRIVMNPPGADPTATPNPSLNAIDAEEVLMPEDALALQILAAMGQMRATSPEVRAAVEPWLEARTVDADATAFVREHSSVLLSGIREARDDSKKPTVEEALRRD
ncbi:MAG TPA: HEAT repeat domain-containing protein [Nannocystaceae bacterium]|nr:HEAT repeat domain-containing protein [Nannocystaceae bacterium]